MSGPFAQEPPSNVEAEETVLGALLLAGAEEQAGWVDKIRDTGLQPHHFYRESLGRLYRVLLERYDQHEPTDPLTVASHLPSGIDVTPERVHELAAVVPAIGLAPHHALLVLDAHRCRQTYRLAQRLEKASLNGGVTQEITAELQQLLETPSSRTAALEPLWLKDALEEPIPATAEYVDGVLEAGVLADIVGLPYLHKSAAALELAVKVSKGHGFFLGKYAIQAQARVAYFWADDSRPQELKRIQSYAEANALTDQPVAFYLNPGITIPEDLPAIRRQVRDHGFRLVVFDSLYNFADFDFVKDTGAVKHLYTRLKRLCDEVEGLTIVLVDHASKPSDSNRDRDDAISSFGSVWKAAAVRCSIVVTKKGQSLFVSATGNNVKGFPKTPAYFNRERLELALAEEQEAEPDAERAQRLDGLVLDYVQRMPGRSTNQIQQSVKGRNVDIKAALNRLEAGRLIADTYKSTIFNTDETSSHDAGTTPDERTNSASDSSSRTSGTRKVKTAWIPLNKAKEPRPEDNGTTPDEPRPGKGSFDLQTSSQTSSPYVVGGGWDEPEGEPVLVPDDRPPPDETAPEAQPDYDPDDYQP